MGVFYGPRLEVAHITSTHLPWTRTQHVAILTAEEAEKCSLAMCPERREIGFYKQQEVSVIEPLSEIHHPCWPHRSMGRRR